MKNPKAAIISGTIGLTLLVWLVAGFFIHNVARPTATLPPEAQPNATISADLVADPPICNGPADASPGRLKIDWKLIPEEQARRDIMDALHDSDVDLAVTITRSLASLSAKSEEVKHVLSFCMANKCFEKAKIIVNEFLEGQEKINALSEIAKEQNK